MAAISLCTTTPSSVATASRVTSTVARPRLPRSSAGVRCGHRGTRAVGKASNANPLQPVSRPISAEIDGLIGSAGPSTTPLTSSHHHHHHHDHRLLTTCEASINGIRQSPVAMGKTRTRSVCFKNSKTSAELSTWSFFRGERRLHGSDTIKLKYVKGGALTSSCSNGSYNATSARSEGGESSNAVSSSSPIDVVATLKTERILVLGGSGFVGTAIAKSALRQGIEVVSLSRTGRPSYYGESESYWADRVTWVQGDALSIDWSSICEGVTAVVSCIGGFGTNEQMEKLNGDVNIQSIVAARQAGITRFIYISVHDYNFPSFALSNGYFNGKRRAEKKLFEEFPSTGVVLRPGFIYGTRNVNGTDVPLDKFGQPLEKLLANIASFTKPLSNLPASDLFLLPPVSVEAVADATVKAVVDSSISGFLDVNTIKETAASLPAF